MYISAAVVAGVGVSPAHGAAGAEVSEAYLSISLQIVSVAVVSLIDNVYCSSSLNRRRPKHSWVAGERDSLSTAVTPLFKLRYFFFDKLSIAMAS